MLLLAVADPDQTFGGSQIRGRKEVFTSMGRIGQSHAQKARGVTTSIHFAISRPGD